MSDSEAHNEPANAVPKPVEASANPVHCAKCFQFNPREADRCIACGAHLWVKCRKCGKKNVRTASRCVKCIADLHPLAFLALPGLPRWFRNRKRKRLVSVLGLLLLAAAVVLVSLPKPLNPTT